MTDEALQQLWKTYQDAWSDVSPDERDRLLKASLAADVVFTSPDSDEQGIDRMVATMPRSSRSLQAATFEAPC